MFLSLIIDVWLGDDSSEPQRQPYSSLNALDLPERPTKDSWSLVSRTFYWIVEFIISSTVVSGLPSSL